LWPETEEHRTIVAEYSYIRTRRKQEILEFLHASPSPITSAELALAMNIDRVEAARRFADAAHAGDVERVGARRCAATGRACITWALREAR
jgi:predicted ArsR family transcriptional regulator